MVDRLPTRWAFKHGAYYYRPRERERHLFEGKAWFRLSDSYPDALRAFADRKELEAGDTLKGAIDRFRAEVLPGYKLNTQRSYGPSLDRLRAALGHNQTAAIGPKVVYQYMDAISKKHTMNIANQDLKVINRVLDMCVRWGVVAGNAIKGEVSYYGKRDGLRKERDRLVADWELAEWQKVASPVQKAFAAITLLTPERKTDILQITLPDIESDRLRIVARKTGKPRAYRMTPALRDALDMALSVRSGDSLFLFTNRDGRCFVHEARCESFDRAWRKSMKDAIRETALEEAFTRHDLRAKVGSDEESEERARILLGHSDVKMTRKHYRRGIPLIDPVK